MVAEAHGATQVRAARSLAWSGLKLRHVWVLLVVCGAFIGPASSPLIAPDAFWSLRRGAWMVEHGQLPTVDPFTSAPHVAPPHVNIQWLADLALHGLERLGGLELVIVGSAAAIALAYGLVLLAASSASGHVRLSCLAVVAAYLLGITNFNPRPQALAYPLFAVFVLAVARPDTRLVWLLPIASAVWANVHGSFPLGLALLGCYAVERPRRFGLPLIACVLATLVTPWGLGTLGSIVSVATNPIVRDHVPEWAPTTITQLEGALFFAALFGLVALLLMSRLRPRLGEVLTLVVFVLVALLSVRGVVWFGLVAAPITARLLSGVEFPRAAPSRERPLLNLGIAAAILALAMFSLPWLKPMVPGLPDDKAGVISTDMPVGAAQYLNRREAPANGRMLNFERWGGYLDWAVWPRHQAFVDGRFELYPPPVWLDYIAIESASPRARGLLDAYGITYAVLSQSEQPELIALLRQPAHLGLSSWRVEYADAQAVILAR